MEFVEAPSHAGFSNLLKLLAPLYEFGSLGCYLGKGRLLALRHASRIALGGGKPCEIGFVFLILETDGVGLRSRFAFDSSDGSSDICGGSRMISLPFYPFLHRRVINLLKPGGVGCKTRPLPSEARIAAKTKVGLDVVRDRTNHSPYLINEFAVVDITNENRIIFACVQRVEGCFILKSDSVW